MEGYMDSLMFRAAVLGDIKVLQDGEQEEHKYFLKTPDLGNNIVHIAAQRGHSTFIEAALTRFPDLVREKNKKGNSPLHEAAKLGNKETINVIISCLPKDKDSVDCSSASGNTSTNTIVAYLCEVNNEGDTPFHTALRSQNMAAAEALFAYVKAQPQLLLISNNFGKTPLHLYVRHCAGGNFPEGLEHDDNNNAVGKPKLIDEMINANPLAIFEHDSQRMNPLMTAAQYGRVLVVHQILANHTHSIECCDKNGRNFLHHLRLRMTGLNASDKDHTLWICEKILEIPGVDTLTVSCDQDGNTPLHKAILDRDFDLAYLILQSCVESVSSKGEVFQQARLNERKELILSIKNDVGKTIIDLITSGSDVPANLKNMMDRVNTGRITNGDKYELAIGYDYDRFIDDLISEGNGSNVIYVALIHGKGEYFETAIEKIPNVIYQKDSNGDTPLHIAARVPSDVARKVVKKSLKHWIRNYNRQSLSIPPWRVKNSRGHTIFHEAVRSSNYDTFEEMYKLLDGETDPGRETDPDLQRSRDEALLDINESGETVLHLLAKYSYRMKDFLPVTWEIINQSGFAAYMRDIDGFAPILRAAHSGHTKVARWIYRYFPTSIRLGDYSGRTVLHHLCTSVLKDGIGELESLLKYVGDTYFNNDSIVLSDLMSSQDIDGNTPLHVGILNRNFEVVQCFIKHFINANSSLEMKELFIHLKNNDGKSVWDMISNGSDIPPILKKLMNQLLSVETTLDDKLYEAAIHGDIHVLQQATYKEEKAQTPDGSNIYHIALRHHQFSFIEKLLKDSSTFELIYKEDSKGDTPLHIAARLQPSDHALNFLKMFIGSWAKWEDRSPPWMVRNSSRGDTILHEAARAGNTDIISYMNNETTDHNISSSFSADIMDNCRGDKDKISALKNYDITDVNDYGETVLHVIARYATYSEKDFLEKHSQLMKSLVYKRDKEGFTPILRAVQSGRLGMARLLAQQFPASVGLRDDKGQTILHHLRALVVDLVDDLRDILPVWKDFFKHSEVDGLRIVQNEDGNTPLHLAIVDADYTKAKFLMEVCLQSKNKQELNIVNNVGHSVFDLLSTQAHLPTMKQLLPLVNRSNVKERESMDNMMNDELYRAAVNGSVQIFDAHTVIDIESGEPKLDDEDYFCRQTPDGNNIVHIALRHGSENAYQFVEIVVKHFPSLSMRPDNNGDTPLHLAVKCKDSKCKDSKCKDSKSGKLLVNASKGFLGELDERRKAFYVAPWVVKNNKGNFPIHEALQTNNLDDAFILLECDDEAAFRVNDLGETPLHSFAKNGFSINDEEANKFVNRLSETSNRAAYMRDDEGLTPLMCAARSGCFRVLRAILVHHPQSAYLLDSSGKTFLHLLRFTGEDVDGQRLFDIPEADAQRLVQDYDGNTPLHHAIQTENTIATISLAKRCLETKLTELELANKRGQTIRDLLALHDVPNEIVKQIRYKKPEAVYLAKRSYGICKTDTKESANALSVVAALLATITFAAAFQVPGGFNGDDGSPILLAKTAFIIFVISNSGAMCCSMLCLFLLLWVMVIGNIHDSLGILDIAIHLLRASFYLTLLTFTMGVFVVTAEKSLWLALLVCGLCFITFLLTWKQSISLVANNGGGVATAINKFKKFTVEPIQEQFNKFKKFIVEPIQEQFNKFKKFIVEPIQEQFNKLRGRCYRNHNSVEEQRN